MSKNTVFKKKTAFSYNLRVSVFVDNSISNISKAINTVKRKVTTL